MGFFDNQENAVGMGSGTDPEILEDTFTAIGSDLSQLFLDRYREQKRNAFLLARHGKIGNARFARQLLSGGRTQRDA